MPDYFPGYNHPWKCYTYLHRKEPDDTRDHPDFYTGPRYIGGKEGPWGRSDFLYTTLEENIYKKDPWDIRHEPIVMDGDTISGSVGNDVLGGGIGNDELFGDAGHDRLRGDRGDDRLYGGEGNDWIAGESGDDLVIGGDGNDIVGGQEGRDELQGGAGNDELWGGSGNDSFVFNTALDAFSNVDWINDFSAAEGDKILLDHDVFTTLRMGRLSSWAFKVGAATSKEQHILYKQSTGELFYDADGSGHQAAIKFAVLTPGTAIDASLFLVV